MSHTSDMLEMSDNASAVNEAAMQTQRAWGAERKVKELQQEVAELLEELNAVRDAYIDLTRENLNLRDALQEERIKNGTLPTSFTKRN